MTKKFEEAVARRKRMEEEEVERKREREAAFVRRQEKAKRVAEMMNRTVEEMETQRFVQADVQSRTQRAHASY